MSTPRLFKFSLQNSAGLYYYVDVDGVVKLSGTEKYLQYSPDNWAEMKRKYGRNAQYWGLFRSTSVPLAFVKDGAKILRSIYYADGCAYDSYVKLTIKKRNDSPINVWQYFTWFETEVDFSSEPEDGVNERGDFFRVNLSDRGVPEIIQDALNTEIEIPIGVDATAVNLQGFPITATYRWVTGDLGTATTIQSGGSGTYYVFPMAVSEDTNEYFRELFYAQNQGVSVKALGNTTEDSLRYLAVQQPFGNVNYTLTATIDVNNVGGAANLRLQIHSLVKNMATDSNTFVLLFQNGSDIVGSQTIVVNVSGTLSFLSPVESYFLSIRGGATSLANVDITIRSISYTLQFVETLPTTTCLCYPYKTFVEKAFAVHGVGLFSSFLNSNPANTSLEWWFNSSPAKEWVTCGDAIRQLASPVIKTSISAIMKDLWSRWMVGLSSFNDNARVERIDAFLYATIIDEIPAINNFNKTTASELLFNKITTGYEYSQDNKLNGKYDFAANQQWVTDIKRVNAEDDLTSPYVVSPFEIERVRSNLSGKNTTSDAADNRVFLLSAQSDGSAINMIKFTGQVNGFLTDEITQIAFTPHRSIRRHIPRYRAILNAKSGIDAQPKIYFKEAERYANFNTLIGSVLIQENGTILPAAQNNGYNPERLFIPVFFDFECSPKDGFMDRVENNPYGVVRFYDEITNQWYSGFIWDIEVSPNLIDTYKMRLLCSPDVNTNDLVY